MNRYTEKGNQKWLWIWSLSPKYKFYCSSNQFENRPCCGFMRGYFLRISDYVRNYARGGGSPLKISISGEAEG